MRSYLIRILLKKGNNGKNPYIVTDSQEPLEHLPRRDRPETKFSTYYVRNDDHTRYTYTYLRRRGKDITGGLPTPRMFIQPPAGIPSTSCVEDWMFCSDAREVEDLSCISWGTADGVATFQQPSFQFSSSATPAFDDAQGSCTMDGDQDTVAKKLSHNANERYRRRRMNSLYSSLRSLLPNTDQTVHLFAH